MQDAQIIFTPLSADQVDAVELVVNRLLSNAGLDHRFVISRATGDGHKCCLTEQKPKGAGTWVSMTDTLIPLIEGDRIMWEAWKRAVNEKRNQTVA